MNGKEGIASAIDWLDPYGKDLAARKWGKRLSEWELHAVFADESEAFRSPSEPDIGQYVTLRLRVDNQLFVQQASVLVGDSSCVHMRKTRSDRLFAWYEARIQVGLNPITYRFLVESHDYSIVLQRTGTRWADSETLPEHRDFRICPGFKTPAWARGAVQYQIFTDRFANGEPGNDVLEGEYAYNSGHVKKARWDDLPGGEDYRCFYGGDLQGIMSKLDYLQSLGVEALYLNPIFVSPSSHKYDTQDYYHVDPHLAVISDDEGEVLGEYDNSNVNASRYIRRTTSEENLARSDELFAYLCQEMHHRGMKVILDGVFNHCGSFCEWMDREGIYAKGQMAAGKPVTGAYLTYESPYRNYFRFFGAFSGSYEAWWNFPTLPKLNYERSSELCDRIIDIARHWASPPYCIDGWRLDVAADLGHSEEFNHWFWKRFRDEVKLVNPDLVIIAEHYGDASPWLEGDQWDTVMNYDAFMEPLTYFLTGMEKHSDFSGDSKYNDGVAFCATMRETMARFEWGSLLCAMNELSNHDHSRFLTRTNRCVGRVETRGSKAAGEGIDKRVLREAVVVQFTWPGAPTIYYGDEAGQVGWTDPDCRRTYPWGKEDTGLIALHQELARIRDEHPALRSGSIAMMSGGDGWIAFGRFLEDDKVAVVCNNADKEQVLDLRLRELGFENGCDVCVRLATSEDGYSSPMPGERLAGTVQNGVLSLSVDARSAVILLAC